MEISQKIVACKYAKAFLNLYFDAINEQHIDAMVKFNFFLRENRGVLCYLNLPGLNEQVWKDFLARLYTNFNLPQHFPRLIQVLIDRRRVVLLPAIIVAMLQEFWRRKNVMHFTITCSRELSLAEQATVIAFLADKTSAQIKAEFCENARLICGIKMRSDSYIFEHSIARELKKFEESLLQRVRL